MHHEFYERVISIDIDLLYMVDLGENYIFAEKVFSNKKLSVSWILWTSYIVSMIKFELALDNIYIDRFRLIKIGEFWTESRRKL